ncbi:MAG: TolC family protein [Gammaproteobacteria bacterium]|nr:TolC family protein [Gammaproteobacteria bacterium]
MFPLTADSLASWVLEANPGLAAIEAAAEAAAYRVDPAGSLDDPTFSYAVAPLTASADRSLNQKFEFSQKIPWPGTLAAREAAARHEAISADRDVDALRLRVIAQAKSAYAEWRFVDEGLTIHHATHALLEELISTTQTRYAAGRALKQDVLQAEVELADLNNHLLQLHRQQATVQARINALLNRLPDAPLPPAAQVAHTTVPPALETLQSLALAQHPELAGMDSQIAANQSRVTLAEKALYPNFQIGVGYNSLWDDTDKRPVFGVSINVPFNRSKRRAEFGRAQAETRRAQWALSERRAELLSELAQARAEVLEAQASVELYVDQLVPLAAEYLEAALTDYQSGSGSFLNVITAEQRKLRTDLSLARARADYVRRLAELERWVGGPINPSRSLLSGEKP